MRICEGPKRTEKVGLHQRYKCKQKGLPWSVNANADALNLTLVLCESRSERTPQFTLFLTRYVRTSCHKIKKREFNYLSSNDAELNGGSVSGAEFLSLALEARQGHKAKAAAKKKSKGAVAAVRAEIAPDQEEGSSDVVPGAK